MVSWNALPKAVAAVPGSLRSRRYRNIHLAGQFKNWETWLGESTSARSVSCPASIRHLLRASRVNAQPDLAQILAGELELQTARGRITFGQPLRQPPLPRPVAGTALGRLPESLWPRCVDSACDRSHLPAPIRLPRGAGPALGRSAAEPASEGFDLHFRLSQPTTRWCAVFRSSSPPS